ncbi:MAG: nucleoside hydrolase [Actinomycetota bacterium]|nr:nucleoside hydrolase [Actinomycetota bacterium]
MSRPSVLIDVDPGIDDALALVYLARLDCFDLRAITVVAGNTPLDMALSNARRVAGVLQMAADVPIYSGCPKPLLRPLRTASHIHGPTGLGDLTPPEPPVPVPSEHAVIAIDRESRAREGELVVIALGPLTNLAAALVLDPRLAHRVRHLVFMGGAARVPGNVTEAAEFNAYVDPEALALVVESGIHYTMIGLDVTARTLFPRERLPELEDGDAALQMAQGLLRFYLTVYQSARGVPGCALHDPLATAVAADPSWVTTEKGRVLVETADEERLGATTFTPEGSSGGEVATSVRAGEFIDHFIEVLRDSKRAKGGAP